MLVLTMTSSGQLQDEDRLTPQTLFHTCDVQFGTNGLFGGSFIG
jgi:hypothetical protein